MAEYYLISQLPTLDGIGDGTPIPITEERFLELCDRFLGKKTRRELEKLTLIPPLERERTSSRLIDAWNNGERELRLSLAGARAAKLNKSFDTDKKTDSIEISRTAAAAVEIENPYEAEAFLLKHRLSFLESLRPMDNFSEDFLYYYGLKLKLLLRIRQFDAKLGEAEYRKIYGSIINGEAEA